MRGVQRDGRDVPASRDAAPSRADGASDREQHEHPDARGLPHVGDVGEAQRGERHREEHAAHQRPAEKRAARTPSAGAAKPRAKKTAAKE